LATINITVLQFYIFIPVHSKQYINLKFRKNKSYQKYWISSQIKWVTVTKAWCFIRFRMEERPP